MSQFLQQLSEVALSSQPFLREINEAGISACKNAAWPNRKTESWKYLSLRPLEQNYYLTKKGFLPVVVENMAGLTTLPDLQAHKIVFVNGCFCAELSDVGSLPEGAELVLFSETSDAQQALIRTKLGSVVELDKHLFAAVNSAVLQDGVFLHLAKNVVVEKPIQIVWLTTSADDVFHVSQRLLVVLDECSSATVIEQFLSDGDIQNNFTHGVTEICLGNSARCDHYRIHLEEQDAIHLGGVYAALEANSHLESFHLALGSALKRIDIVINHNGAGAECDLNGIYLPRENQQLDYHTCIEHRVPHCTTREVFRGIVGDSAKAVFNGRIHIHPKAQKTLAQLSNKNLLLSDKSEVDTKPELEIYADDVQCAHGATVARLDLDSLHYFRTRGIPQKEAEVMLSFGFINELISHLKHPALSVYLRPVLNEWFSRDSDLVDHFAD